MVEKDVVVNKFAAVDGCIGIVNHFVVDKNALNELVGIYVDENKFVEVEVV